MNIVVSLILVVFFLAMNAFFVVAEFALVRVRKSQLELAVEKGERAAKNALVIAENVNSYLSACQLGITLASLALGWLGEPAFSALIRPLLAPLGIPEGAISAISIAIGYFLMTTLHVVAGELIPKSLAIFSTERYALATATPLIWFYRLTYPIMWLFNSITTGVVKLLGHDPANEHDVYTGEEIQILIDESTESGLIDPDQNELVDNIFDLDEKDAASIMTPRTDMICLDIEDSLDENLMAISEYKYTRYAVCKGDRDRILGYVHVKDLYMLPENEQITKLPIRPIVAVPETMPVTKLLQTFQAKNTKMALVIDEHGGTAGIVTMSDVMEQFVGPLDDEYIHDDSEEITQIDEHTYLIDGAVQIDDLCDTLGFEVGENFEADTAGGLLLELFERIPHVGESVEMYGPTNIDGLCTKAVFRVVDMDRFRIDKIELDLHNDIETKQ